MFFFKKCHSRGLLCFLGSLALLCAACDHDKRGTQWADYGGGGDQSKYVEVKDITKSNVHQLKIAWQYDTGDENPYQFNPIIVDTFMYVFAKDNALIALHAATGKELWVHTGLSGLARRGINYWESKDRKDRRLLFQMNDCLQAIDAVTGKSILAFGKDGLVDLKEGLDRDPKTVSRIQSGSPGVVFENLLLLGSSTGEDYFSVPGFLRAYDVISGKLVWTFHTIPRPGEFGYDTWPKDAYKYAGGVNTWGEISVDTDRGIAYFPLGSPTYDYYGGDRAGSNLYGNCLLALDARTGKRIWHYQLVHHDLWDYDLSAAPQLVTVDHDGKPIDAVAIATKHGFLFAFNRVTGESLWPIEERPVPPSELPGEQAWPTQPFPTVLPPFARQGMTSADLTPFFLKEEDRALWKKKIDSMQTGLFTPLSAKKATVTLPGAVGGANWGATAANPKKGMVYVRSIDWPSFYGKMFRKEMPKDPQKTAAVQLVDGQSLYLQNCMACHGADKKGAVGPPLLNLGARVEFSSFKQIVTGGKGEMPSFHQMDENALKKLYQYLAEGSGGFDKPSASAPKGPVVASGGAPGGQESRKATGVRRIPDFGVAYPETADAPTFRYFVPPGYGLDYPYLISPPWSSIVAYDLNSGTIKWKVPVGEDLMAKQEGGDRTGVPRAQRNGMIVTSSGIIFCTSKDAKIYAFDADDGKVLWVGQLPTGTEGLPSIYEVNGRHYLVVCAAVPVKWSVDKAAAEGQEEKVNPQGQYVVFSLPNG